MKTYFEQGTSSGETLETCLTVVVEPGGDPVDRVYYDDNGDYQVSDDTQLTWK